MGAFEFAALMFENNAEPTWDYPTAFGYLSFQAKRCAGGYMSPRQLGQQLAIIEAHQREYHKLRQEGMSARAVLEHLAKLAGPDPRGSDSLRGSGATPR